MEKYRNRLQDIDRLRQQISRRRPLKRDEIKDVHGLAEPAGVPAAAGRPGGRVTVVETAGAKR